MQKFNQFEIETRFETGIEDIIKPLQTLISRTQGMSAQKIFQNFDADKNNALSVNELAAALRKLLAFDLTEAEKATLEQYFKN